MDVPRPEYSQRLRKRRIALAVGAGLVVASAAVAIVRMDPAGPAVDREALLIDTVRRGEFVHQVRGPGVLEPRDIRWIVAQAPGRVERILVRPGMPVEADTVIVELSNPEAQRVADEARWALSQGDAELAALRLQLQSQVLDQKSRAAEVRANYESARLQAEAEAAAENAVSALQARRSAILAEQLEVRVEVEEERLANLREATAAQLRAQSARIEQLRASLASRRELAESLHVRAGLAGVLQVLPVQVGQQIAAGAQIARVARPGELVAELCVPELSARDLRAGLAAKIDTRNGIVAGRVSRVDPTVENGSVRVEVTLEGALPPGARPDLSVDGLIEIERLPDVVFVGRPVYGEPDAPISVFRLDAGGSGAQRVPARLGKASANEVVVLEGLQPGDRIVLSDVSQWSRHDHLRIR
jgi:HlyD family secretion protein